jgi:hypothetical protein
MVAPGKSFTSIPYLTGQNQLQLTYNPTYPDISAHQWGIDSISFTFLVGTTDYDLRSGWAESRNRTGVHVGYKLQVDYLGQPIFLFISLSGRCTVRLNAARLEHQDPLNLLDPDLLLEHLEKLLIFLFPYVSSFRIWKKYRSPIAMHSDWVEQINLSRLDIAANLANVTKGNLHSLELTKIPRSNTKVTFKIPSKILTIEVRTKNEGKDQIYDKTHQLALEKKIKIPLQVHRFESQLRGKRLKQNINLKSINRTAIWSLLESRWQKAGFEIVEASPELINAILDIEPRIGKSIVNYLRMKEARLSIDLSSPTISKYEKIIKLVQGIISKDNSQNHLLTLRSLFEK